MNHESLRVIKWYCRVGFALPFNLIRFLISALCKGKFQVISYKKQKKGVFMKFEADDELAKAIDGHGHSLRAGICRVVLKKKVITNKVAVIDTVDSAKDAETPAAESAVISSEITATKPQS